VQAKPSSTSCLVRDAATTKPSTEQDRAQLDWASSARKGKQDKEIRKTAKQGDWEYHDFVLEQVVWVKGAETESGHGRSEMGWDVQTMYRKS